METLVTKLISIFGISYLRYIIIAGLAYATFYVWKKRSFIHLKIQQKFPDSNRLKSEILNSTYSLFVFSLFGVCIFYLKSIGYTKIYTNVNDMGIPYLLFSIVTLILVHDTYFYWAHRAMHHKKVYRFVHRVHHDSTNPTPFAAFSFHPLEAIIEVGILPIFVFILPLHPIAILVWLLFMTFMNVLGHLGFEIFPSGFTTNPLTKLSNTSVHHNMHHKYVNYNFGLYFNFWDKWMGTNHPNYHQEFESVASKQIDESKSQLQEQK